jgi:hypothetical protein
MKRTAAIVILVILLLLSAGTNTFLYLQGTKNGEKSKSELAMMNQKDSLQKELLRLEDSLNNVVKNLQTENQSLTTKVGDLESDKNPKILMAYREINKLRRLLLNTSSSSSNNTSTTDNTSNSSSSNIASVSIYNTNKNVLAKFDLNSNSISLGSGSNPAISITNNIYTPNIIVCNYTFNMATSSQAAQINLNYISNFVLQKGTYLNFMINTTYNFYLSTNQPDNNYIDIYKMSYNNNILKLLIKNQIPSNAIINLPVNIITYDTNNPIYNILTPISTNGFLTIS